MQRSSLVLVAVIFGIIMTILMALPVCCGVGKNAMPIKNWKIVAGVCMGISIFIIFIPAIASTASTHAAIDDFCDRCSSTHTGGCRQVDKDNARAVITGYGMIIGYTAGFGFVAVILGIVGASLACCICCEQCHMKQIGGPTGTGGGPVVGEVVGAK